MWWKIYFFIASLFVTIALIDLLSNPVKHVYMALIDTVILGLLLVGLYSYVFKKIIFQPIIWKIVFWIALISSVIAEYYALFPHSSIIPYLSYVISKEPVSTTATENVINYLFGLSLFLPLFYAVFQLSKGKIGKDAKELKVDLQKVKMKIKNYKTLLTKKITTISRPKNVSKVKIIISVVSILIVGLVSYVIFFVSQALSQLPYVERMVDNYLSDMSNEHYSSGYGLFSEEFKKREDFATFERKRKAFRYGFKEYKYLESNSINVNYYLGNYPVINYGGTMYYQDGEAAMVTATFIYINNNWEMVEVFVVVPPER